MREQVKPEGQQPLQPKVKAPSPVMTPQRLETSDGVDALTSKTTQATPDQKHDVSYEVFLEQVAHDMAYNDQLTATQRELLDDFGYRAEPSIDGPHGFEMRVFLPSHAEYNHPIIAFRGTEFTSLKDLQTDLAPKGVGYSQFQANQRRIEQALQRTSRYGRAWVTGHSLGGALAQLTAAQYSSQVSRVITFQSPGIDAASVQQLERYNARSQNDVESTHYQVKGDVVSTAGDRLTPGEVIQFDMQNSTSSRAKSVTAGVITGILVGPATGVAASAATEAVAKHRAFPVTNAAQEHPAFVELFEEGKNFERVAGISKDTFQPRTPVSSETFKPAKTSNFLRHTIGRSVFAIENASSNWGADAKAREFAERNKQIIHTLSATTLLEHLGRLLDGWVSDDDIVAFETICYGVENPEIMREIRNQLEPRLEELHSDQQRQWVADALAYVPKKDKKVQRSAIGTTPAEPAPIRGLGMGTGLEANQRQRLEEFFGTTLETVKIHTDDQAKQTAKSLGAVAATIGEDILLSESANSRDDELMAHEVAHVIQQREARVPDGVDKDTNLETEAQNLGRAFVQGKPSGKKKSTAKTAESKAIQRKITAKTTENAWTREFSGKTGNTTVLMNLTRAEDGTLTGTYQLGAGEAIAFEGKILNDGDIYLQGADDSKWNGRYTENDTLLFGNVEIGKKTIKKLELKPNTAKPEPQQTGMVWKDRVINASINGNRFMMKLDKTGTALKADEFYLETIGAGTAVGELEPNTLKIKKLVFTFTSGEKKGETREIQDGFFVLLNGGKDVDKNKDGKNDATGEDLPVEVRGHWVNPKTNMKYEILQFSTSGNEADNGDNSSLEVFTNVVLKELPKIMARAGKGLAAKETFEATTRAVVNFCWNQGIKDKAQIISIVTNAAHESGMNPAKEEDLYYSTAGRLTAVFGKAYFKTLESEKPYLRNPEALANYVYGKEMRSDLGNTAYGDGYKYRGRGLVQITGKHNYQKFTDLLAEINFKLDGKKVNLVENPELTNHADVAVIILVLGMKYNLFRQDRKDEKTLDSLTEDNASTAGFKAARINLVGGMAAKDVGDIGQELFAAVQDLDLTKPAIPNQSLTAKPEFYKVKLIGSTKVITVKSSEMTAQGQYPTTTTNISWQPTSIATTTTAQALSDVRGSKVNLGDKAEHTATEFLAVGSDYGGLMSAGIHQVHTGWDLNVVGDENLDKPAYCAADGVIVDKLEVGGFGRMVIVFHPQLNRWSRYAHLESFDTVNKGDVVKAGTQIGFIGKSGGQPSAHLHFDIIKDFESSTMWNGLNDNPETRNKLEGDYDGDKDVDVNDRIDYVKDHFEDPAAFFSNIGVSVPQKNS